MFLAILSIFCLSAAAAAAASSECTLTVFRNTLDVSTFGTIGGATLVSDKDNNGGGIVDEFTMCFRFRLKILGSIGNLRKRGNLLNIGDWNSIEAQLL
jgi:hypothetical protein